MQDFEGDSHTHHASAFNIPGSTGALRAADPYLLASRTSLAGQSCATNDSFSGRAHPPANATDSVVNACECKGIRSSGARNGRNQQGGQSPATDSAPSPRPPAAALHAPPPPSECPVRVPPRRIRERPSRGRVSAGQRLFFAQGLTSNRILPLMVSSNTAPARNTGRGKNGRQARNGKPDLTRPPRRVQSWTRHQDDRSTG